MSKTVDERIVEMRFDNKQFETNAAASMSTLDKLKEKLNFKGAAKGLDTLNNATKNVNMNNLGQGVDAVNAKFSTLQVVAMTAISRLTNAAITAGQKIASAITIDPIRDGFREYETQLNAVQTILANTQSEGTNVKIVNKALDELNTYADKTIYNFTEMTRNIGTFTAAGVKLNDSVNAIKGIANLAAVSGSTSQQASVAMYQLSQALAAGSVKLQDWNSVVNAGMGGKVFQDALIRTSEHLKTGAKNAIKAKGSFRESMQTGWLTKEVLTQTLDQFATAADTQEEYEAAVKKFVSQGYTQEEAKQMADMARTAGEAATKVKTFTQLIDTLKEALGSGWAQTWRLVFGDFEEAKSLWTGISDVLGDFINKMSDARNKLLESALGKGFGKLTEKIDGMLKPAKKASDAIKKTVDTVSDLGDIVDKVIGGKFGNGKERFDALSKAGYNWCEVQNKVNEKLGNSFRYTKEQIDAQDKLIGSKEKVVDETKKEKNETVKLTKEKKNLIKKVASMTEEQMRSKGYTDEQIAAFKELGDTAKKLGMPLNEFIDNMDKITGRWLLIESFKNIGRSIAKVLSSIGKAWRQTFDAIKPETIFNLLAGFHKLTRSLILSDENSKKLVRTFKGLFALIDIISTVVGGGFKLAFKAVSAILGAFDLNVLDVTASIGDLIVKFRDFLFDNNLANKAFVGLASGVKMAAKYLAELANEFRNSEIGKNLIDGIKNGLKSGITEIPKMLMDIGKSMLTAICNVLGIHSPSVEMEKIGMFTIQGLVNGLKSGLGKVWDVLITLGSGVIDFIKNFNWDKAFAVAASSFLIVIVKKMVDVTSAITAPLEGLGDVLSGTGKVLRKSASGIGKIFKSFAKLQKAKAFKTRAEGFRDMAIAIGIIAASVYILAKLDIKDITKASIVVAILSGILVGLSIALDKLSSASIGINKEKGLNIKGLKSGLIGIGLAILLIAKTVKIMGGMNEEEALNGFSGLAKIILMISGLFAVYGLLVKGKAAQNMDKAGKMMKKLAISMLLMLVVCKLAGMLSPDEMLKGAGFAAAFLIFVGAMSLITRFSGKGIDKLGGMMLKISFAMLLMIGVCKLVGKLTPGEMIKAAIFAKAFIGFVGLLVLVTKIGKDEQIAKLSGLLMSISFAMLLMVGVCKLVGLLSISELLKGAGFAAAFIILIKSLVAVTKIGKNEQMAKVAGTILATSFAIAVMAGVCILLSLINVKDLLKGVAVVTVFGLLIRTMITATKGANDVKGNLIAMSVAIGIMAVAIAALSFIDPTKLLGASVALSMLMGMFALMTFAAKNAKGSMGTIIVLTVVVGALAGIIYLLSTLNVESALGVSASISLLLISMSASLTLISVMGPMAVTGLVALAGVTLIVAGLAGILYLMRNMDPTQAIGISTALTKLIIGMSACCLLLSAVGFVAPMAIAGTIAMIGVITAVGAFMIGIGALVTYFPKLEDFLDNGLPLLEKIGNGIGSFFGGIINGFGEATTKGLPKIAARLSAFMVGLQPFILGAKQITEESVNGVKSLASMILMITGANLLESITSFITGESSIDKFSSQLSIFGDAIIAFSNKIKGKIDEESVLAAANAGKMMAEMIKTIPSSGGVFQVFTGEKNMPLFKEQLAAFGEAIVGFSNKVSESKINNKAVKAAANAGKIMIEMQNSLPSTGGVFQLFTGEKNMATFGTQLKVFGEAIVSFSETVSKGDGIDVKAIKAAANAGSIMSKLQENLTATNGVVQWFTGKKNLDEFGTQIKAFGKAITYFSKNTKVDEDAVSSAANAGKVMSSLQKSLPESHWFDGKMTLDEFGDTLVDFGKGISGFAEEVADISNNSMMSSINAAFRLATLAERVSGLDTSGISDFEDIDEIGSAIKSYYDEIIEVNNNKVSKSLDLVNRFVYAFNNMSNITTRGLSEFKQIVSIGTSLNAYHQRVSAINTLKLASSIKAAGQLKQLLNGLSSIKANAASSFNKALNDLAKANVNGFIKAFSGSAVKMATVGADMMNSLIKGMLSKGSSLNVVVKMVVNGLTKPISNIAAKLNNMGKAIMIRFISGVSSSLSKLPSVVSSRLSSVANSISSYSSKFKKAGINLGAGLIIGIRSQVSRAYHAGYVLGQAAVQGEKDGQRSNSPSKLTIENGKYLGEGLIIGISSMLSKVYSKGYNLGETAVDSIAKSISKISEIIENGIDAEPTIRPVLDLSNVVKGVNRIENMFNKRSYNVSANIGAVSSMMSNRQNGISDTDLLSEIKGIRGDLAAIDGGVNVEVNLDYNAGANANDIANDIARNLRRVIRRD